MGELHRQIYRLLGLGFLLAILLPLQPATAALLPHKDPVSYCIDSRADGFVFNPELKVEGILQPGGLGLPGERVTWVITLTNSGNATGSDLILTDTLRPELRVDEAATEHGSFEINGNTVMFVIPTLEPGRTLTMQVFSTLVGSSATGIIANEVTLTGGGVVRSAGGQVSTVGTLPATGYPPLHPPDESAFILFGGLALLVVSVLGALLNRRRSY